MRTCEDLILATSDRRSDVVAIPCDVTDRREPLCQNTLQKIKAR